LADPLSTGHGSLLAAASNWADKNILPILRFPQGVSNWATDMSEYRSPNPHGLNESIAQARAATSLPATPENSLLEAGKGTSMSGMSCQS
jgi:hypothetical protein